MSVKREIVHIHNQLLDHIKFHQVDKAKSIINEEIAKGYNGSTTLLHQAAFYDNEEIARHLLQLGAEVDSTLSAGGNTPLILAVRRFHRQIVVILLKANANINIANNSGHTALRLACASSYEDNEIADLLLRKLQSETMDSNELVDKLKAARCPLHRVIYLRNIQVIQGMLKRGSNINLRDYWNGTVLHHACRINEAKLVKWLINHGANINVTDKFGMSPLLTAACFGNKETMTLLLEAGADPNVTTIHNGYTPVHLVCIHSGGVSVEDTDDCLELLLQYGAVPQSNTLVDLISENGTKFKKFNMLINHLAMLKELGRPIADSVFHCKHDELRSALPVLIDNCRKFLNNVVFGTSSLFELLTDGEAKMKVHVRNNNFMSALQKFCTNDVHERVYPFYCNTLAKRIFRARRAVKLEETAIGVVEMMNRSKCHVAARMIVDYLNEKDLEWMSKII